jgi:hypothetical protein
MKKAATTDHKKEEDENEHDDLDHLNVPEDKYKNRSPVVGHAGQDTLQSLAVYEDNQPRSSRHDQNEGHSEFESSIKLK